VEDNNFKNLVRYIFNIITGVLFGSLTSVVIIGIYPFAWPVIGFLGPFGYIITQVRVAKRSLLYNKSKLNILSYVFSLLGSIMSYILGLYYGLSNFPRLGYGTLYGVFAKEGKKDKKERASYL